MRRFADVFALAAASALLAFFVPRSALAQVVSEADRQAARELFQQGFQLQQAGNYEGALDKFERAQAVFSAPTNLLHIAECQAQLGQLVESSETYRGLARLALPKDTPQAFVAAQTQGAAELQQIEPRIPRVRIDVTPPNIVGLGVAIDDQPMNVALIGVDRPIDPGTHKVAAFAQGYGRQEKTVVIVEKDPTKPVAFALQRIAGALAPSYNVQYTGTVIQMPYAVSEKPWVPPPRTWTSTGFFFGARGGAAIPTGTLNQAAKAGAGVGIEGYFRFAHKGFLGILGEHEFFSAGSAVGSSNGSSNFLAGSIGFTTNAEGVGFIMDFFGGYRSFAFSNSSAKGNPSGDIQVGSYGSGEGGLGMGVWIAAGKSIRVVPRFEASFGSLAAKDASTTDGNNPYAVVFLGVSVDYNIDLKGKE